MLLPRYFVLYSCVGFSCRKLLVDIGGVKSTLQLAAQLASESKAVKETRRARFRELRGRCFRLLTTGGCR